MTPLHQRNLYRVLGVSPSASPDVLKSAYRQQAFLHHPDRGGHLPSFEILAAAYEVLGDMDRRRDYETLRAQWLKAIGAVQCAQCGEANRIRRQKARTIPCCGVCEAALPSPPQSPIIVRAGEIVTDLSGRLGDHAATVAADLGGRLGDHAAALVQDGIELAFDKLRKRFRSSER